MEFKTRNMQTNKIYTFHLLNDYSGSPKVLMQLAKGWVNEGLDVHIVTCSGRDGFLSDIANVTYHYYWYKWAANPYIRLFNLMLSQLLMILMLLFKVNKKDIIYINTVLPFGAAFLGKLKGCRVIYHVHETSMKPPILKKFLFGTAKWAAKDAIYVSQYLSKQEEFSSSKTHILYNAIEDEFLQTANNNLDISSVAKKALMVCSLKDYKGVSEFVQLAKDNPNCNFRMVMNATQADIDGFFNNLPYNIELYDVQTNLHPFYQWADIILNLSRPDGWVETFGLTIIEGMAYGLPAIVPPVGGITELVNHGENGFLVDCRNTEELNDKFTILVENDSLYKNMVDQSLVNINKYSEKEFINNSMKILTEN